MDQAHKEELEELNNKWENIQIPNTINEMQLLLIEMRNRHMNELEELRNFQLNNPTAHYHASPQLIALRKKEEYIAIGVIYMLYILYIYIYYIYIYLGRLQGGQQVKKTDQGSGENFS